MTLHSLIKQKRKELKSCNPKSWDRVRDRLRALELLKVLRGSIGQRSKRALVCDHRVSGVTA